MTTDMAAGTEAEPAGARELLKELQRLRRSHSDRSLWQAFEAAYLYLFAVLLFGSMGAVAVNRAFGELSTCVATTCQSARTGLLPLLAIAVLALTFRAFVALGPIVIGRATATFLLSTPASRARLLMGRAVALLVFSGLAFLALGALIVASAIPTTGFAALGALLGGSFGLLLAAGAVALQGPEARTRTAIQACDLTLLVVVLLTPIVLWSGVRMPELSEIPLLVVGLVALIGAIALAAKVTPGLGTLTRRQLVAGGDLFSGLSGAAASMDTSMVADLLVHRRFRRLGARPSRRGRFDGLWAIPWREALRSLRSPARLVLAFALLVVPYIVARIGLATIVPLVAVVAGYFAVRPMAAGLHAVTRSGGLRRAFLQSDLELRLAFAAPAVLASLLWALFTLPALASEDMWSMAIGLAAAISAGVVRSQTRPPVTYDGPLISTPAGALPAGFVTQIFRGPDVLVVCGLLLTLGLPLQLGTILSLAALAYVLGKS